MRSHAVRPIPSNRSLILAVLLLVGLILSLPAARAATLGVVTDIDRATGTLAIDGRVYRVDSFTEVRQTDASGAEEVAAWYSLDVGNYVIFEASDGRISSLRRKVADSLDRPPGRPLEPGRTVPEER